MTPARRLSYAAWRCRAKLSLHFKLVRFTARAVTRTTLEMNEPSFRSGSSTPLFHREKTLRSPGYYGQVISSVSGVRIRSSLG